MAFHARQLPSCLLVEDSDFDQRRIARLLEHGTRVDLTIRRNLAEARAALARGRCDVMLLDNLLPDGLGVDFAGEIRASPRMHDLPIILISDFPSPFMYDKAMAARVSIVLDKDKLQPKHVHDALQFARIMATSRR